MLSLAIAELKMTTQGWFHLAVDLQTEELAQKNQKEGAPVWSYWQLESK